MADLQSGQGFFKLMSIHPDQIMPTVGPMMAHQEMVIAAFKSVRDSVVFTDKRIIAINVQGMMSSKTTYTSFPYSKVQAYSIETAGMFDRDCELELYFSAFGKVKFELKGNFDIVQFNRMLSQFVL